MKSSHSRGSVIVWAMRLWIESRGTEAGGRSTDSLHGSLAGVVSGLAGRECLLKLGTR